MVISLACIYIVPPLQNPSSTDLNSTVASLNSLLLASSGIEACAPAEGAEWIKSSTSVEVLSATSGAGTTQSVTSCDSDWGAAVVAQVPQGGE